MTRRTHPAVDRHHLLRLAARVGFDIQSNSPVPESSSMALLGLGIAAAIGLRARRAA